MNHHHNIVIANLVFNVLIFLMLLFFTICVILAIKYAKDVTDRLEKIENK